MSKTFYEIWSHTWNESQANGADLFIPVTGSNYVADLLQLDTSHKWVVGSMRIAGLKIPLTPMRTNELVRVNTGYTSFPAVPLE